MPTDPLGRGLESLIPDRPPEGDDPSSLDIAPDPKPTESESAHAPEHQDAPQPKTYQDHFIPRRGDSVFSIEMDKIDPNPYQPRREFNEEALEGLAS